MNLPPASRSAISNPAVTRHKPSTSHESTVAMSLGHISLSHVSHGHVSLDLLSLSHVRQQSHVSGTLDRRGQASLVPGAVA